MQRASGATTAAGTAAAGSVTAAALPSHPLAGALNSTLNTTVFSEGLRFGSATVRADIS